MSMENNNRGNGFLKFLFGMFFGVLAGYLVGILTADRTGAQLRRDIEMGSSDFFANMRDKLEDLKDQATVKIKDLKDFADEKLRRSAENIQEQVHSLGNQLDELTKRQKAGTANKN